MDRGAVEADFFRSHEPWSSIDKDKAGIKSLRLRLKEVHSSLVKRVFPKVSNCTTRIGRTDSDLHRR
jgi:hypothetical protein